MEGPLPRMSPHVVPQVAGVGEGLRADGADELPRPPRLICGGGGGVGVGDDALPRRILSIIITGVPLCFTTHYCFRWYCCCCCCVLAASDHHFRFQFRFGADHFYRTIIIIISSSIAVSRDWTAIDPLTRRLPLLQLLPLLPLPLLRTIMMPRPEGVLPQVDQRGVPLRADGARKCPFGGVRQQVSPEVALPVEGLPAPVTPERSLAIGVAVANVAGESGGLGEGHRAGGALVGPSVVVGQKVPV